MNIEFKHVSFTYAPGTPFSFEALKDVSFRLKDHVFMALIGETGSGKSTLVQHINGLLTPTEGEVSIGNFMIKTVRGKRHLINLNNLSDPKKLKKRKQFEIKELRKYSGLVFQFPEYQLFEETVLKDVEFGPRNFGCSEEEAEKRAKMALELVGIKGSYFEKSPFELSGGEKRRVAIAGIIASEPQVLVLDEPTAGLDPQGEKEMMALFRKIYEAGTSVVLVTHNMDIVLSYVDEVCVMSHGQLIRDTTPLELFQDLAFLKDSAIEPPLVFKTAEDLILKGMKIDLKQVKDISSLAREIKKAKDNG
jgi:energy-coupling factor transport system ATP-binding protein